MTFDFTVSIGTVIQAIVTVGGGGIIWGSLKTNFFHMRQSLDKLASVPETLARHDERLKNLER